jgi:hypothetical protein
MSSGLLRGGASMTVSSTMSGVSDADVSVLTAAQRTNSFHHTAAATSAASASAYSVAASSAHAVALASPSSRIQHLSQRQPPPSQQQRAPGLKRAGSSGLQDNDELQRQLDALVVEIDAPTTHVRALTSPAAAASSSRNRNNHAATTARSTSRKAPAIAYLPSSSPVAGARLILSEDVEDDDNDGDDAELLVMAEGPSSSPSPSPSPSPPVGRATATAEAAADQQGFSSLNQPQPQLLGAQEDAFSSMPVTPLRGNAPVGGYGGGGPGGGGGGGGSTPSPATGATTTPVPNSSATNSGRVSPALPSANGAGVGIGFSVSNERGSKVYLASPLARHSLRVQSGTRPAALLLGGAVGHGIRDGSGDSTSEPSHSRMPSHSRVVSWVDPPLSSAAAAAAIAAAAASGGGMNILVTPISSEPHTPTTPLHNLHQHQQQAAASGHPEAESVAAEEEDDEFAAVRSCWCFRPHRIAVARRFPSDEVIASGPTKAHRARHAAALAAAATVEVSSASSSASPSVSGGGGGRVVAFVDAHDLELARDFLPPPSSSSSSRLSAYAFVPAMQRCWLGVAMLASLCCMLWRRLELYLLAALHLLDTCFDVAMVVYWSTDASMSSNPFQTRYMVAGTVFLILPTLVHVVSSLAAQRTAEEHLARPVMGLVVLDVFQARGFLEAALVHREYDDAPLDAREPAPGSSPLVLATSTADAATVVSSSPSSPLKSLTADSADAQSANLTRMMLQCVPMLLMQSQALAMQLDSTILDMPPPTGVHLRVAVASMLTSLLCIALTVYRFVSSSPAWRSRAGPLGRALLAITLLLLPAHKYGGYVLLILQLPWWQVLLIGLGSFFVTSLLSLFAEWRSTSPSRRANVSSILASLRIAFLVAPCEHVTGGVGAHDLVVATATPTALSGRSSQTAEWVREYWPLQLWHGVESGLIAALYAVTAAARSSSSSDDAVLWPVEFTAFMGACVVGRWVAMMFLLFVLDQ